MPPCHVLAAPIGAALSRVAPPPTCLSLGLRRRRRARAGLVVRANAKELHFNRNGETLKRMQAGVDKLATVVGVTLGPKVRVHPSNAGLRDASLRALCSHSCVPALPRLRRARHLEKTWCRPRLARQPGVAFGGGATVILSLIVGCTCSRSIRQLCVLFGRGGNWDQGAAAHGGLKRAVGAPRAVTWCWRASTARPRS
jgi:hypothetical protein